MATTYHICFCFSPVWQCWAFSYFARHAHVYVHWWSNSLDSWSQNCHYQVSLIVHLQYALYSDSVAKFYDIVSSRLLTLVCSCCVSQGVPNLGEGIPPGEFHGFHRLADSNCWNIDLLNSRFSCSDSSHCLAGPKCQRCMIRNRCSA